MGTLLSHILRVQYQRFVAVTTTQQFYHNFLSPKAPELVHFFCMAGVVDFAEVSALPAATCWKCKGGFLTVPCPVCEGAGVIRRTSRRTSRPPRASSLFPDFHAPGPSPPPSEDTDLVPGGHEELCYLAGHWKLFQHKALHRYSTDDVVCAWAAHRMHAALAAAAPRGTALRTADVGCGIGSVLLMTAWLYPEALCVGVEAQPSRAAQAARSIRYNGVSGRVSVRLGDLRDPSTLPPASFDLVTGTPPYFDIAAGAT
jgi:hypothetical protein